MKKTIFFILLICWIQFSVASIKYHNTLNRATVLGILELHKFNSTIFNNSRYLRVLLPADYYDKKNSNTKYKVLYMNDGQNLFEKTTSVFNPMEWEIDETLKILSSKHKIEPIIVVGIDNAGKRIRPNEYLPWADEYLEPPYPNPNGRHYPDFLTNEVIPYINAHYRVRQGPANTGLGGSSYGGLITLYTAIKKPDIFGFILIESPSFYVNKRAILDMAREFSAWPDKIYLGVGTNELGLKNCEQTDGNREPVQDVQEFFNILVNNEVSKDRIHLVIEKCALHNEAAWALRFPKATLFWLQNRI
jgi:predicted alpha/beta superfamily hydrolase